MEEKRKLQEQVRVSEQKKEQERLKLLEDLQLAKQYLEKVRKKRSFLKWIRVCMKHEGLEQKAEHAHVVRIKRCMYHSMLHKLHQSRAIQAEKAKAMYQTNTKIKVLRHLNMQSKTYSSIHTKLTTNYSNFVMERRMKTWNKVWKVKSTDRETRELQIVQSARSKLMLSMKAALFKTWKRKFALEKESKWRELRREALRQRAKEMLLQSTLQERLDNLTSE